MIIRRSFYRLAYNQYSALLILLISIPRGIPRESVSLSIEPLVLYCKREGEAFLSEDFPYFEVDGLVLLLSPFR